MGVWEWIKQNVDVDVTVDTDTGGATISTSGATDRPGFSGRFGDVVDVSQVMIGAVIAIVALKLIK